MMNEKEQLWYTRFYIMQTAEYRERTGATKTVSPYLRSVTGVRNSMLSYKGTLFLSPPSAFISSPVINSPLNVTISSKKEDTTF